MSTDLRPAAIVTPAMSRAPHLMFVVSEDWYFRSHRLALAQSALQAGFRVSVATRVGGDARAITDAGVELIALGMDRRRLNPLSELGTVAQLRAVFTRHAPDVVHAVAMKPIVYSALASLIVPGATRPRLINSVSGLGSVFISSTWRGRLLKPMVRALLGFSLRRPGAIGVIQNRDDAQLLRELGVPAERLELVAGSGIDLERFSPGARPHPALRAADDTTEPAVLLACCVSRMLVDKGIHELVAAARLLREREVPVRVVLVGAPDPHNPTSVADSQLRAWQAQGLVDWVGRLDDIPAVLAASDIAVLPSYREGLPQSLLEAAASGLAMVATDVPGCREVCIDGRTGIAVPARDAVALADALERLVREPALRERYARAARALAEERFGTRSIHARFIDLYRSVSPGMDTGAGVDAGVRPASRTGVCPDGSRPARGPG
ncbi:MAG: glycosyltransferase family 4 protein [Gammaproteobacteria bacterium]|nr:glycosyltransferase family 4 protein [Gammaproteobacteria bacterium]